MLLFPAGRLAIRPDTRKHRNHLIPLSETPMTDKQQAIMLIKGQRFEEARALLEAACEETPDDAEAWLMLSTLNGMLGSFSQAEACARKALGLQPGMLGAYANLGNALQSQGMNEEAIKCFRQAVENNPNDYNSYNNMGYALSNDKLYEEAEICYLKAIEISPEYAEAQNNLGVVKIKKQEPEKALEYFRQAVKLNPEYLDALFNMGTTLKTLGVHKEALACFSEVIKRHPEHTEAGMQAANILFEQGNTDDAHRIYSELLQFSPGNIRALTGLTSIFLKKGNYAKAIEYGNRAVQNDPRHTDALYCLGSAYLGNGDTGKAISYFRKVLESSPTHVMALHHLSALEDIPVPEGFDPEYVANLFDKFSSTFDNHLVNDLKYKIPEYLGQAVKGALTNHQDLNVLDLGCGTGLCGIHFRENARQLVGVDLSRKMLEIARNRGIYDELILGELMAAFKHPGIFYDLIVAADVFVYLGVLDAIFRAITDTLAPDGIFAFSIEAADSQQPYVLHKGGRYAHSLDYIQDLARQCKLGTITTDDVVLRMNEGKAVTGYVILLCNKSQK